MTTTINAENILKVADAIEAKSLPGLGFTMDYFIYSGLGAADSDKLGVPDCGTVACIAGWANMVMGERSSPTFAAAAAFFGITEDQGEQLFYARNHPLAEEDIYGDMNAPLEMISVEEAVRTLRHLAATGVVDWTV